MGETLTGIPLIIDVITQFFTGVMTMVGNLITTVMANPLLLFFVVLGVVGIAVGFLSRLLNLR